MAPGAGLVRHGDEQLRDPPGVDVGTPYSSLVRHEKIRSVVFVGFLRSKQP